MYSNPKPLFKATAEKKIHEIQAKCAQKKNDKSVNHKSDDGSSSSSNVIDLTIQVRTFIDTEGHAKLDDYFNKTREVDTYRHCALRAAISAQNQKRTGKSHPSTDTNTNSNQGSNQTQQQHRRRTMSTTPLCVYVTSDSPQAADDIRAHLEADPTFNGMMIDIHEYITLSHSYSLNSLRYLHRNLAIRSLCNETNTIILTPNTTDSCTHPTGAVVSYTELGSHGDWHTMSVLNKGGHDTAINPFEIAAKPEFTDWYILSTSTVSMYTDASTFAASARRRAGYFNTRHDLYVKTDEKKGNKLVCEVAKPMSTYCDICTDKLTGTGPGGTNPCPVEIQKECAAGIVIEPSSTASSPTTVSNSVPTFSPSSVTTSSSSSSSSKEGLSPSSPPMDNSTSSHTKRLEEYESVIADLKTRIAKLEAKENDREKEKEKAVIKNITNVD